MRFSILEIFVSAAAAALQNFVFCHWNSQRILFCFSEVFCVLMSRVVFSFLGFDGQ